MNFCSSPSFFLPCFFLSLLHVRFRDSSGPPFFLRSFELLFSLPQQQFFLSCFSRPQRKKTTKGKGERERGLLSFAVSSSSSDQSQKEEKKRRKEEGDPPRVVEDEDVCITQKEKRSFITYTQGKKEGKKIHTLHTRVVFFSFAESIIHTQERKGRKEEEEGNLFSSFLQLVPF